MNPGLKKMALAATFAAIAASIAVLSTTPSAVSAPDGEQTFKNNCAACHAGGGNTINPKKPLKGSPMLATKDAFKAFLCKPAAPMPPFPQVANDAATLDALYKYCKTLK